MGIIIIVLLAVSSSITIGQELFYTDTVWINASRYGYSFLTDYPSSNIIDGGKLYDDNRRDIIELIERDSNILLGRNSYTGSGGFFNVRGRSGSVLLDGFLLDMPQLGGYDIGWISQAGLGHLELIKGPASVFYGQDALGGAINILPHLPQKDTIVSSIYFERGKLNYKKTRAAITSKVSSRVRYRIDIVELGSNGARENERFLSNDFSSIFLFDLLNSSSKRLGLTFWVTRHKGTLNIPSPYGTSADSSNITLVELSTNLTLDTKRIFNFKLFFNNAEEDYFSPFQRSSHRNTIYAFRNETFIDSTLIGKLSINIDGAYAYVKSSEIGTHKKYRLACFLADRVNVRPKLLSIGALRFERSYTGKGMILPMLGVKYICTKRFAFANLRLGTRTPTLNDLYWPYQAFDYDGDNLPEYINEGNPGLESEINWGAEFGVGSTSVWSLTIFYSRAKNLIQWSNVYPGLPYGHWKPVNIPDWSEFKGVELKLSKDVSLLDLSAKLTYLDAKDYTGKRLPYRPSFLFDGSVGFKKGFLKNDGFIRARIDSRYWHELIDELGQVLKSPVLLDGNLELGYLKASLFITVENILDEEYSLRRDYPQPGMVIRGGFRVNFAY